MIRVLADRKQMPYQQNKRSIVAYKVHHIPQSAGLPKGRSGCKYKVR